MKTGVILARLQPIYNGGCDLFEALGGFYKCLK